MKCCNCCDYGPILPDDALSDRLYWVEVLTGVYRGEKFAAWRDCPDSTDPWLVSAKGQSLHLSYRDEEIRVIHEIIPED